MVTSGKSARRLRIRSRASGSSSAMSAVTLLIRAAALWFAGNHQGGFGSRFGMALQGKLATRPIQLVEPHPGVRKADSLSMVFVRGACAIVEYGDLQRVLDGARPNFNPPRSSASGDSVLDGVLHQRLKDEERHGDVEQRWIDILPDGEPIAEADSQDVEVRPQDGQLLAQRDFLNAFS